MSYRGGTIEIGDLVWWRGRCYYLRGVEPASLPVRGVQLEDLDTGERCSGTLDELESELVGRIHAYVRPRPTEFPQQRVSNLGRRIAVDRLESEPEQFVFTHAGRLVAELHPPAGSARARRGAPAGWRLTFPTDREKILAAPPDAPPISGALFFIDMSLSAGELADRDR